MSHGSGGFRVPNELKWIGTGDDPRRSQTKLRRPRRPPERLTANLLLSDDLLAARAEGLSDDPKLPESAVDERDRSICADDLRFSVMLEFAPHRLADLGLSQREIDFNTWYRCERFVQLHDALEGGYCDGDHDRADRWLEMIWQYLEPDDFMALRDRIQREVRQLIQ